jgi:5-methylcytosine-specific restriction endonuclease McrA
VKKKQLVRERFRDAVFKRDGYACKKCGMKQAEGKLDAHHIVDRTLMPNGGYVVENGITLCDPTCHMLAEKYHISGGEDWEPGMHPDDLYAMVGSSYEKALAASERLSRVS